MDARERLQALRVAERVADLDALEPGEDHDVAGLRGVELDPLETARAEEFGHAEALGCPARAEPHGGGAAADPAAGDAPDHQPAHEVVPAERAGLELERALDVDPRRRRVLEDRLEQRAQIPARSLGLEHGAALDGRAVDHREVELRVVGAELDEEVEHLVDDRVPALSGRSTLFTTRIRRRPCPSAFRSTKRVCGITPSTASTTSSTPSTSPSTRSTSPPKSEWPGVSTSWMRTPSNSIEVTLERIVMPRSRSRSPQSMTRSGTAWCSRNAPV